MLRDIESNGAGEDGRVHSDWALHDHRLVLSPFQRAVHILLGRPESCVLEDACSRADCGSGQTEGASR